MRQRVTSRILVLGLLLLVGCGDNRRASVSGKVTLDGQPVDDGVISFFPTDGNAGPTAGDTIKGGKYTINATNGVATGLNKVQINANRKTGKKVPNAAEPGSTREEVVEAVPAEYNSKSTLKVDVKPGANTFDFDLTTAGK